MLTDSGGTVTSVLWAISTEQQTSVINQSIQSKKVAHTLMHAYNSTTEPTLLTYLFIDGSWKAGLGLHAWNSSVTQWNKFLLQSDDIKSSTKHHHGYSQTY